MTRGKKGLNLFGKIFVGLCCAAFVVMIINALLLMRTDDRLPNLDESYDTHVYLAARGNGHSFSLTGEVLVTVMFVDDPDVRWTQADKAAVKAQIEQDNRMLEAAAAEYGAELTLTIRYLDADIDVRFDMLDYRDWAAAAVETTGHSMPYCSTYVKNDYDVKEAPYMLCTPHDGRSFAKAVDQDGYFEYGVLFGNDAEAYAHELCHLFGAMDYYYPQEVAELAEECFGSNLMLDSTERAIDPLTAYLLGWTDEVSEESLHFLDETAWITDYVYQQYYRQETYTGTGTRTTAGSTYTGQMVQGIAHGTGRLELSDGSVYEGEFYYGSRQGQGTYTWADGAVYEGEFSENMLHGQGKYTWIGGAVYEGQFFEGVIQGEGTYTWADGTVYEGQFMDGELHGAGQLTYPNGTVLSGTWEYGEYIQ